MATTFTGRCVRPNCCKRSGIGVYRYSPREATLIHCVYNVHVTILIINDNVFTVINIIGNVIPLSVDCRRRGKGRQEPHAELDATGDFESCCEPGSVASCFRRASTSRVVRLLSIFRVNISRVSPALDRRRRDRRCRRLSSSRSRSSWCFRLPSRQVPFIEVKVHLFDSLPCTNSPSPCRDVRKLSLGILFIDSRTKVYRKLSNQVASKESLVNCCAIILKVCVFIYEFIVIIIVTIAIVITGSCGARLYCTGL